MYVHSLKAWYKYVEFDELCTMHHEYAAKIAFQKHTMF